MDVFVKKKGGRFSSASQRGLELVKEVVDFFLCQTLHGCCIVAPVKTKVAVGGFGDLDAVQGVEGQVVVVQTKLVYKFLLHVME